MNARKASRIILVISLILISGDCTSRSNMNESKKYDYVICLEDKRSLEELNEVANDEDAKREDRCKAIASIFFNYIESEDTSAEVSETLHKPSWLEKAELAVFPKDDNNISVDWGEEGTLFEMLLFPKDGWSEWRIYFILPGEKKLSNEGAIAFLNDKQSNDENVRLLEYAIHFPNGRIAHFKKGEMNVLESANSLEVREMFLIKRLPMRSKNSLFFIDYGYLGDDDVDPPDDFLKRLSDLGFNVKKISEANIEKIEKDEIVFITDVSDSETGEPGWIVTVWIRRWIDKNTVEVEYYDRHSLLAGRWVVNEATFEDNEWSFRPRILVDY